MDLPTGTSYQPFSEYLAYAAHRYHPRARNALLLGLGCGVLAKRLNGMGVRVTVAELEPDVVRMAREHFALPDEVEVAVEDARAYLHSTAERFDLVILDAFAGESAPWYLLTREALQSVRAHLTPGGRLVVNTVTVAEGRSEGLRRLEAASMEVFGEAVVFLEPRLPFEDESLVNATLVAGAELRATDEPYPPTLSSHVAPFIGDMHALGPRPARAGAVVDVDDHSDLDWVDVELRSRWRREVIESLTPGVLLY
jgi:SAM-dependent methyltransferase